MLSMTGSGMIVVALTWLLSHFGVNIEENQVLLAVNGLIQVVGVGMTIWGQLRRKDLHMGLIRKS